MRDAVATAAVCLFLAMHNAFILLFTASSGGLFAYPEVASLMPAFATSAQFGVLALAVAMFAPLALGRVGGAAAAVLEVAHVPLLLLGPVAAFLLLWGLCAPGVATVLVGLVFGFSGLAAMELWCAALSGIAPRRALLCVGTALVLSGVLAMWCSSLAFAVLIIVLPCIGLLSTGYLSIVCLGVFAQSRGRVFPLVWPHIGVMVRLYDSAAATDAASMDMAAMRELLRDVVTGPLLGFALFSLTAGTLHASGAGTGVLLLVSPLLAVLVLFAGLRLGGRDRTPLALSRMLLPPAAIVLFILKMLGADASPTPLFDWGMSVLFSLAGMLCWTYMVEYMRHGEPIPALVVLASQAFIAAAGLVGAVFTFASEGVRMVVCGAATTVFFFYVIWDYARAYFTGRADSGDMVSTTVATTVALSGPVGVKGPGDLSAPKGPAEALDALAERWGLTPREREVLALSGRGHTAAYVAQRLSISENTARNHLKNIYRKVGVGSREELIERLDAEVGETGEAGGV